MSVPLDLSQQKQQTWFKPNKKIGFYLGFTTYDKVGLELNGVQVPIPSMGEVKEKVESFKSCMEKYLIREEDSILLLDPEKKQFEAELEKV